MTKSVMKVPKPSRTVRTKVPKGTAADVGAELPHSAYFLSFAFAGLSLYFAGLAAFSPEILRIVR